MEAVVKIADGYDHMELMDIPEPEAVRDLVKIKVAYTGICGTDLHTFRGTYPSTKTPVVLGHEFSGIVTAVGPDVKRIRAGDRVTSETTFLTCGTCIYCKSKDYNLCSRRVGIGTQQNGSMARYVVSREESVHIVPDHVSLLSAALSEPLACGVHAAIERGKIEEGETVCIFGAGAIGLMVAQIAKAKGCTVLLAGISCDRDRFEVARKIGIHRTVDQMKENINEVVSGMTNGIGADKVFECSGAAAALNKGLEIIKKKGRVIQMGVFPEEKQEIATDLILHKEIELIGSRSQNPGSWEKTMKILASGKVVPEITVSKIITLDNWRAGFESALKGEGIRTMIECNEGMENL